MKQSERIKLYKKYSANEEKQSEYERKRRLILSQTPNHSKWAYFLLSLIPVALAVAYGWFAFAPASPFNADGFSDDGFFTHIFLMLLLIAVGITNLVIGGFIVIWGFSCSEERHKENASEALNRLNREYGIYHTLGEVNPYGRQCGEHDDYGDLVCSVSKQRLNYTEYRNFCQAGKCNKCARFIREMDGEESIRTADIEKW